MKKIKFKVRDSQKEEVLSREELKQVIGGDSFGCSSGPCTLAIYNTGTGQWVNFPGNCATTATPIGSIIGAYTTCYCNAVGGPIPLQSNGGISRCGNGGVYPI